MNFNLPDALKMFKTLMAQYTSPTQNKTQTSSMNMTESIFGNGFGQNNLVQSFGLQNTGLTDDMLMQAFGFQKSGTGTNKGQSVDALAQRAESAIAKAKGALEAMKASGNDDVYVAETDSRMALMDLQEEINNAMQTANDADKIKLQELSKKLEEAVQTQTDERVKVLNEAIDYDNKIIEENCPSELGETIYNTAENAQTKEQIEKSISDIKNYIAGSQRALSQVKGQGIKEDLKTDISYFEQKLGVLEQRKAGLKTDEEK